MNSQTRAGEYLIQANATPLMPGQHHRAAIPWWEMPRSGIKAGEVVEAPSACLAPVTLATGLRIVAPVRTTVPLSHSGQRTPAGQRRWRTKAKHLASAIRPERLTKSDAVMMAKAPCASRLAARAL